MPERPNTGPITNPRFRFNFAPIKRFDPPATMDLQQKQVCCKLELEVLDDDASWVCFSTPYIIVSTGSDLLKLLLM